MFNSDNKVNKIIGNEKRDPVSSMLNNYNKGFAPHGFGRRALDGTGPHGFGPHGLGRKDVNSIVSEMQRLLDRMPEVKSVKGNLNIEFKDGDKSIVKLSYDEQPFKK